jgi:hypothetical protein
VLTVSILSIFALFACFLYSLIKKQAKALEVTSCAASRGGAGHTKCLPPECFRIHVAFLEGYGDMVIFLALYPYLKKFVVQAFFLHHFPETFGETHIPQRIGSSILYETVLRHYCNQ